MRFSRLQLLSGDALSLSAYTHFERSVEVKKDKEKLHVLNNQKKN